MMKNHVHLSCFPHIDILPLSRTHVRSMIMISLPFPIHIHPAYVKRDVFQFQKIFQVIGRYYPMSRKKQEKKMSRSYQQLAVKSVDDN